MTDEIAIGHLQRRRIEARVLIPFMITGFNDELELARSQTLMQGGRCCDFRFRRKP